MESLLEPPHGEELYLTRLLKVLIQYAPTSPERHPGLLPMWKTIFCFHFWEKWIQLHKFTLKTPREKKDRSLMNRFFSTPLWSGFRIYFGFMGHSNRKQAPSPICWPSMIRTREIFPELKYISNKTVGVCTVIWPRGHSRLLCGSCSSIFDVLNETLVAGERRQQ